MARLTLDKEGALTLPPEITRGLGLRPGEKVEVNLGEDRRIEFKADDSRSGASGTGDLYGLLNRPGAEPVTIEEMDEAIGEGLARDDARIRSGG